MSAVFLFLFFAVTLIHLVFCLIKNDRGRALTKPLILISLITYTISWGRSVPVFIPALIFCLLGDIFLIGDGDKKLIAGGASFSAAHIFLIAEFSILIKNSKSGKFLSAIKGGSGSRASFALILVTVLAMASIFYVAASFITMRKCMDNLDTKMTMGLYTYLLLNGVMNIFALFLLLCSAAVKGASFSGAIMIYIGALLFFLSDCILFKNRFSKSDHVNQSHFPVMLLYSAGMFLITQGIKAFI
jgi:uncharacterized membrane protein YhhN